MSGLPIDANDESRAYAERLHNLFLGADHRHGIYRVLEVVNGKAEIKDENGKGPQDIKGPPTVELWEMHLASNIRQLGVSPVRADGMCRWGILDVDDKGVDFEHVVAEVAAQRLPVLPCRSKSGRGGHCYLFAADWMPQSDMNAALSAMAARLPYKKIDIFPPADSAGNWVCMPYGEGDKTDRYAAKARGLAMSVAEFLEAAESARQSPTAIAAITRSPAPGGVPASSEDADRAGRKLAAFVTEIAEAQEGGRAKLLYGLSKDMGKMIGAGWIEEDVVFDALMEAATRARLPYGEAAGHVRNGIKDGKQEPPDTSDDGDRVYPDIENIVRITGGEETMWRVAVKGRGTVKLTTRELDRYELFTQRCMETLMVKFQPLKTAEWAKRIQAALLTATSEVMPEEETVDYRFRMALQDFCFDRHLAETPEEMAKYGKPWHDDENDRIYFRFDALYKQLCELPGSPFRGCKNNKLGEMLKAIGRYNEDYCISTMPIGKGKTAVKVRWVRKSLFDEIVTVPPRRLPAQPPL